MKNWKYFWHVSAIFCALWVGYFVPRPFFPGDFSPAFFSTAIFSYIRTNVIFNKLLAEKIEWKKKKNGVITIKFENSSTRVNTLTRCNFRNQVN